jgi:hypothetical protein
MNKSKIIKLTSAILIALLAGGCASVKVSDRCLTYSASGDTSVSWAPIEYYQAESPDMLYIAISKTSNYIPSLEIIDTEYNQPYKVDYTFDNNTYMFKVKDNYDEYLLYRDSYDGIEHDRIYVRCNRQMKY